MKKIALTISCLLALMMLASCERTCRCYHYNGTIVEFTQEEVKEKGQTCTDLENINMGLTYSLCEWVF